MMIIMMIPKIMPTMAPVLSPIFFNVIEVDEPLMVTIFESLFPGSVKESYKAYCWPALAFETQSVPAFRIIWQVVVPFLMGLNVGEFEPATHTYPDCPVSLVMVKQNLPDAGVQLVHEIAHVDMFLSG